MNRRVEWTPAAARDMQRLETATAQRVRQAVRTLAASGNRGLTKLSGRQDQWRLRVGDWRAIITFADRGRIIRVLRVLHRRDAYR